MGVAKTFLRPLKRWGQQGLEALWSCGFAVIGRLLRPSAELWSSDGGRTVLVLAPHPDDEVAGCAGVIVQHRRCGDRVVVAYLTDGRCSTAYAMAPEEMADTRRQEAQAAARVLGVDHREWLGLPENAWRPKDLEALLRDLLERHSPDYVYAPSRIDFHFEHEQVARALAAALDGRSPRDDGGPPVVRVYPVQVPLTPCLSNLIAPLTDGTEDVREAVNAYYSQVGTLERCLRHRRYLGRLYALDHPVEEFWQVSAGQYRLLHDEPPARSLTRTFRGLRYYAWSDPLAYLCGQRERRRLARRAAGPGATRSLS